MRSTFSNLEVARRGMFAQQQALATTGHNIANASTPGFTRQRVEFKQTEPFPPASMNRPQIPGQMGTGVTAGTITRVREGFLDVQYRGENNKMGYWEARADSLEKMEEIMNEPSETGLSNSLNQFWQAFQDLAVDPTNAGARSVVRQRGMATAETFNYLSNSLTQIRNDIKSETEITLKEINSIAEQLASINKQIGSVEPHGYLPNDLYDERDRLLDNLSKLVNIQVEPVKSSGSPLDIAEGMLKVSIVGSDGTPRTLVNVDPTLGNVANYLTVQYDSTNDSFTSFEIRNDIPKPTSFITASATGTPVDISTLSVGKLRGLTESFGMGTGAAKTGLYSDMLSDLDDLAYSFATEFNRIHESGWTLTEANSGTKSPITATTANSFFEGIGSSATGAASGIKLGQKIIQSTDNIAAAGFQNGAVATGNIHAAATTLPFTIHVTGDSTGTPTFKDANGNTLTLTPDGTNPKVFVYSAGTSPNNTEIRIDTANFPHSNTATTTFNFTAAGVIKNSAGNGSNALALADIKNKQLSIAGVTTNVQNFYEGMIGSMAVQAQEAERLKGNSEILKDSVDQRRQSISSVSLDEEMTNMITFQHAYNASARMITVTDELLDRIINNMGVVGR